MLSEALKDYDSILDLSRIHIRLPPLSGQQQQYVFRVSSIENKYGEKILKTPTNCNKMSIKHKNTSLRDHLSTLNLSPSSLIKTVIRNVNPISEEPP